MRLYTGTLAHRSEISFRPFTARSLYFIPGIVDVTRFVLRTSYN